MTLKVASCRWIFLSLFFVVGLSVALTTHAETHLPVRAQSAALKAALIDTQNSYDATQSVVGKRRDDIVSTLSSSTDAERARILARRAEFAERCDCVAKAPRDGLADPIADASPTRRRCRHQNLPSRVAAGLH